MAGMADIFGEGKPATEKTMPVEEIEETGAEGELPPGFQEAYDEHQAAPSADAMYRMIEACKGGGGLDLLLGKPKGK